MSLLDEARAEQRRAGGYCSVKPLLDDDLEEAIVAVREKQLHSTALERALSKRGIALKADTIRRHANQQCSCDVAA